MSQPAFFLLKELFCYVHVDSYRPKSFGEGALLQKATGNALCQ